jgi:YD repeat-containing protein
LIQELIDSVAQLFRRRKSSGQIVRERERRMKKLDELLANGSVTQSEYDEQRRRIEAEAG